MHDDRQLRKLYAAFNARVAVDVDQTVRDCAGALIGSGRARHVYTFGGGLVARMDLEPGSRV